MPIDPTIPVHKQDISISLGTAAGLLHQVCQYFTLLRNYQSKMICLAVMEGPGNVIRQYKE